MKIKISVALATYNEEENLGRCLDSVQSFADEIVIVDGSSEDRTVEVAKKYKAQVIVTDNPPIFHINKQKAIDASSGEWILQLDADEVIPPELAKEIVDIAHKGSHFAGFWAKRKNYFLGRFLKRGGQFPDPVIRFFKKEHGFLPCQSVHEQIRIKGEVGWLENPMFHFSTPAFSRYLTNSNRYTSLTAEELSKKDTLFNLKNHINYFLFLPASTFFKIYFRHKGFVDGFPGFVFALFSGLHYPVAYVKLWEKRKNAKCA